MGYYRKYPYHTTGSIGGGGMGGGNPVWNFKCRGGGGDSALNFRRGKTAKASLETFPVCKSSMNQQWKQDKD